MNLIYTAIVLALIGAAIDYFVGLQEPWRKFIIAAIAVVFILGLLMVLLPGAIPLKG